GVDHKKVELELLNLITSLKLQNESAFSKLSVVFAGMSGVDRLEARSFMEKSISKLVPNGTKVVVDIDGVNALYSGTYGAPGIVQIAGTGSITFGMNANGDRGRAGGWGYLIDDEGGGYDLGKEALHAIFKEYDGRGKKTILTESILKHFNVSLPPELIQTIYQVGKAREVISPLSRYVAEAADQQDEVAKEIIHHAGRKIGNSIGSLAQQLFHSDETVPVVLVGGVFNRSDLFLPAIESVLKDQKVHTNLIKPKLPPVGGAVIKALQCKNVSIQEGFEAAFIFGSVKLGC
ncbi:N-acetylglucosamine kinase, partial [Neobacillus vireti]|uniref:N-acetylglucosamine kinase n=1 Tax=Neobacillus vireti TaxID=220686 RepID=UPI002FFE1D07